ncbi:DUF1269 domain-containing protein [Solirubrobacter soli]|uniref:DUF1269 domain-containing protein n=1 Tax=Solirubrobacter soli TaxID=363832 RepID=UPI0004244332|nr:DUF1269 domain-containing protein [Solirubrobacter soli]
MSENQYVLAAAYASVEDATADFQGISAAFKHVGTSGAFDAIVLGKDADGKVEIVDRLDEATHHARTVGIGWGMAGGIVAALFPGIGILGALAIGGATGAAIGTHAGHAARAMSREDLKTLGEVLDSGEAGLVVFYGPDMADRVSTGVSRATTRASATTDLSAEQLAAEIRQAQAAAH